MWIPLPDGLVDVLNLVGFTWPEADEELLWNCGTSWRTFASNLRDITEAADTAARKVISDNSDDSITAFSKHWRAYVDDQGYLVGGADAADLVAGAFFAASAIVIALKIAVIVQLIYLACVWIEAIATAIETLGASIAAAGSATVSVRSTVRLLFRAAIRGLRALGPKIIAVARKKLDDVIKQLRRHRGPAGRRPRGGKPRPRNREDAEDILNDGARVEKQAKRKTDSNIYAKSGGADQAKSDFDDLTEGLAVSTKSDGTQVARLPDGSFVTLRKSSDGRVTISIQGNKPYTKYRYDP